MAGVYGTAKGRDLTHKQIARRIVDAGEASGWWAQSITVAYEQHIGRRAPGQDHRGEFQLSVTRVLPGTMDDAMARWLSLVAGISSFGGLAIEAGPRINSTDKWRRWGVTLADGTRVTASVNQKTAEKAGFSVTHERLESPEEVERWRLFWKDFVAGL